MYTDTERKFWEGELLKLDGELREAREKLPEAEVKYKRASAAYGELLDKIGSLQNMKEWIRNDLEIEKEKEGADGAGAAEGK